MDKEKAVNHTFADHSTYLHRRDTLHKTEKDYAQK